MNVSHRTSWFRQRASATIMPAVPRFCCWRSGGGSRVVASSLARSLLDVCLCVKELLSPSDSSSLQMKILTDILPTRSPQPEMKGGMEDGGGFPRNDVSTSMG
ncbi:unnamed protein product [Lampetra planeri]